MLRRTPPQRTTKLDVPRRDGRLRDHHVLALRALPGVKAVSNTFFLPWAGGGSSTEMRPAGSKGEMLRTQMSTARSARAQRRSTGTAAATAARRATASAPATRTRAPKLRGFWTGLSIAEVLGIMDAHDRLQARYQAPDGRTARKSP